MIQLLIQINLSNAKNQVRKNIFLLDILFTFKVGADAIPMASKNDRHLPIPIPEEFYG
jgi:hypothetical protein